MAKNREHYESEGRRAYEIGVRIVAFGFAWSWQAAAFQRGYRKARDEWRTANPGADEFAAGAERIRAAHARMFKGGQQ